MDPKTALTNGVFCPMPWTGLMYNFDGSVKNCIRSAGKIGNIKNNTIQEILVGPDNLDTQSRMLSNQPAQHCHTCYNLENGKKRFDIVSDRIFYMRELKSVPFDTYRLGNHSLQTVDVRWSNLCNFSCVYCGPEFSSRWASELEIHQEKPTQDQIERFKSHIFDHAKQLKHVYMAGGEPLLMKENLELLEVLHDQNPDVHIRINTNLSKVDTKIFEKICLFKNVHWTISVETQEEEFEYIRHGGKWIDFLENLEIVSGLDHKISFNMLYFLLNFNSLFDCIDFLRGKGFHPNSFIVGALLSPVYLDIRHLPNSTIDQIEQRLRHELSQNPGYLLEDSLRNLLHYIRQPFDKNLAGSMEKISKLDQRRGLDSSKIFKDLYSLAQGK